MVSDFIEEHVGYLRLTPTEFAAAQALSNEITNEVRQIIECMNVKTGRETTSHARVHF